MKSKSVFSIRATSLSPWRFQSSSGTHVQSLTCPRRLPGRDRQNFPKKHRATPDRQNRFHEKNKFLSVNLIMKIISRSRNSIQINSRISKKCSGKITAQLEFTGTGAQIRALISTRCRQQAASPCEDSCYPLLLNFNILALTILPVIPSRFYENSK